MNKVNATRTTGWDSFGTIKVVK